jgi:dolichol-phosphate mannosyltransferase
LEVVIVDDSSPDGTADLVRERFEEDGRVHLIMRAGDRGYGTAMVEGFRWCLKAGAGRVVTMDADFAHDPDAVPLLLEASEESDLVIGSRYAGGVRVLNWSPQRLLLSMFANRYARTILGSKVRDMTSGFRCYRREVLKSIGMDRLRARGYAFLVQMLYYTERAGFEVQEVPIVYTERRAGQSKMSKAIMFESALVPWKLRFSGRPGKANRPSGG